MTSLPEINGNLKCRIGTSSLAEAIGILITRSAKIARNLGRVITPEHVALLSYLIFFGEQQAGRWLRRPYFILEFYPIKDAAIYEPGSLRKAPCDGSRTTEGAGLWKAQWSTPTITAREQKKEKDSGFIQLSGDKPETLSDLDIASLGRGRLGYVGNRDRCKALCKALCLRIYRGTMEMESSDVSFKSQLLFPDFH